MKFFTIATHNERTLDILKESAITLPHKLMNKLSLILKSFFLKKE